MLLRFTATVVLSVVFFAGVGMPRAEAVDVPAQTRVERVPGLAAEDGPDAEHVRPDDGHGHVTLGAAATAEVSRPTRMPMPFSMVGFALPQGATVDFRTSVDGSEWTAWHEAWANPDEGPDAGSPEARQADRLHDAVTGEAKGQLAGRTWTEPVWVGEAIWIQTRVTGAATSEVGFDLIDSAGLSRTWLGQARDAVTAALRTGGQASAHALEAQHVQGQPEVVSRAQWGADESMRRGTPSYSERLRFGVVHHTATTNDYSQQESPAVVRGIYAYHVRSNGWSDIGYNLMVDRFGTVYEGRSGGVDRNVIGAHAGGFNTNSFGVAFIGSHATNGPSTAAFESMAAVFAWKFDLAHVDVGGAHTAISGGSTRYRSGTSVVLATMSGHRDVSSTTCPGQAPYQLLPELRHQVLQLHGDALLDHKASPRTATVVRGKILSGSITMSTRLRPAGSWQLEVRDPSGAVVHHDAGSGTDAVSSWEPIAAEPGTYTYTFSAAGRRSASETIELLPPVLTAGDVSPRVAKHHRGDLVEPVTVSAKAFPGAEWTVTITDPTGAVAHRAIGTGEHVRTTWDGPATTTGTHRWTVEAVGAKPLSGAIDVFADLLRRSAVASDAVAGSVELSQLAFSAAGSAPHAVIARADVFADTLSAGPLAGSAGPVLLNPSDVLDPRVRAELERVLRHDATVYVLGGEQAVSAGVADALDATWNVHRLAGRERTETAAAVAEVVLSRGADAARTAMIARSGSSGDAPWADALAGGAYGAASGIPVLLTDSTQLSQATAAVLEDLDVDATIVLGGTAAVSEEVMSRLPSPRRVSGPERASTAVEIARQLWGRSAAGTSDSFLVADGYRDDAWTLALSASPLGARASAPLLLSEPSALPPATEDYLHQLGYGQGRTGGGYVLGGEHWVSTTTADLVSRLLQ